MSQYLGDISAYALAVSQGYTGTEEEYAELMASYATVGQTAVTAAQTATTKASEAATSATTATTKASEATTAATTATTKAGEASTSASTATSAKDTAVSASQTATTKATEATTAAATATSAATTATTAKDDAVSAKTAAQTAQTGAETAAASVQSSAAQIQTNADDISELKEDLNDKANTDGSYDTLTAGNAKQILSNLEQTDMVPYNYRTAGGSLEIGDREKLKKIVGGSVAWNQLVQDGNFPSDTNWTAVNGSISVSENVCAFLASEQLGYVRSKNAYMVNGNKYFRTATLNANNATSITFNISGVLPISVASSESYQTLTDVINWSYSTGNQHVRITDGRSSGWTNVLIKDVMLIDLTAMFGTTIADYVYGLETATAGAGAAWLKQHFPKIFDAGYIPYNAGTLEHVSGLSAHKMTGFNQWDEEWENGRFNLSTGQKSSGNGLASKNKIRVLPNTTYYATCVSGYGSTLVLFYYDASENFISYEVKYSLTTPFTTPNDACYMNINLQTSSAVTDYNHDICINLHWDGERDGEYEPYEEHSYPLDSDVTLRGIPKLDANNSLYYDGDEYVADGTVERRYGIVDLGTLTWTYFNLEDHKRFGAPLSSKPSSRNLICTKYQDVGYSAVFNNTAEGISIHTDGSQVAVYDTAYTDAADFKTAMSGVYLVYELATPTTESADPYTEIQNVSNWGTEEFVTTSLVPVGHVTEYQPDLRAKIEVAPESPDTDGLYLMKRENGQNSYVAYLGELPSDPTTDGTYTLKCTVSGGTATKTWEADE